MNKVDNQFFQDCGRDILKRLTSRNDEMQIKGFAPLACAGGGGIFGAIEGLGRGIGIGQHTNENLHERIGEVVTTIPLDAAVIAAATWTGVSLLIFAKNDLPKRVEELKQRRVPQTTFRT